MAGYLHFSFYGALQMRRIPEGDSWNIDSTQSILMTMATTVQAPSSAQGRGSLWRYGSGTAATIRGRIDSTMPRQQQSETSEGRY